jgi:hypothetical protein
MKANGDDISEESQRDLAAGVFKQVMQDLRRFRGATSRIERELYLDAYRWLTVDECSSPFSFLNVCQSLNLKPENVRQQLLSDISLGPFRYWTRRCGRSMRQFRTSFSQFFRSERNANAGYASYLPVITTQER